MSGNERRPGKNRGGRSSLGGDIHRVSAIEDVLTDLEFNLLSDAFRQASRKWWLKRADDFERAKPRLDEFYGNKTVEELRADWTRCHDVARACRAKAALIEFAEEFDELWKDAS